MNLIDLIAIAPFFIDLIIVVVGSGSDGALKMLRLFRLARVFRIFKLSRYNSSITLCATAMYESKDTLGLMGFMLSILVIVFSSFIFFFEEGSKNESLGIKEITDEICMSPANTTGACTSESQFVSIPGAMWWTIVTVMTVGYGDMYPLTNAGRVIASILMLCSIIVLALPISVIGANFSRAWMERKELDEKFMDGHEVSIVYRNLIHNLSEHGSILEEILCEGTQGLHSLHKSILAARREYDRLVQEAKEHGLAQVNPSKELRALRLIITEQEEELKKVLQRVTEVHNAEFDQAIKEVMALCSDMQRVVAEQCLLSAKIEVKEKFVMGRLLCVPTVSGNSND